MRQLPHAQTWRLSRRSDVEKQWAATPAPSARAPLPIQRGRLRASSERLASLGECRSLGGGRYLVGPLSGACFARGLMSGVFRRCSVRCDWFALGGRDGWETH